MKASEHTDLIDHTEEATIASNSVISVKLG